MFEAEWKTGEDADTTTKGDPVDKHLQFDFGQALMTLRQGNRVARYGWNGKNMWICLQFPDVKSKMTLPYIYMKTAQGDLVPWLASQTDLLASDWETV